MGKREQEQGFLQLPASQMVGFRKSLVTGENKFRQQALEAAEALYAELQASGANGHSLMHEVRLVLRQPRVTAGDVADVLRKGFNRLDGSLDSSRNHWTAHPDRRSRWDEEVREKAIDLLVPHPSPGQSMRLQSPKRKDLMPLPATTTSFSNDGCSIQLDEIRREVKWQVDESNNAVERAWKSRLGRGFAAALEKVTWVRGTGGFFRYSDEHSLDAAVGGKRVTVSIRQHFGPLGEQEFQAVHGCHPATRRAAPAPRRPRRP